MYIYILHIAITIYAYIIIDAHGCHVSIAMWLSLSGYIYTDRESICNIRICMYSYNLS